MLFNVIFEMILIIYRFFLSGNMPAVYFCNMYSFWKALAVFWSGISELLLTPLSWGGGHSIACLVILNETQRALNIIN